MQDLPGLIIVITDGHRARIVRPGPDNTLHTTQTVDFATDTGSQNRPEDQASGTAPRRRRRRPARGRSSRDSGSHSEPEQLPFARLLAARLSEDVAVDLFSDLVLVGPRRMLSDL